PVNQPQRQSDVALTSEEVYDLLIRPEDGAVDRLLFLTPHLLFDLEKPQEKFAEQVKCCEIEAGEEGNWHYPLAVERANDQLKVRVHEFGEQHKQFSLSSLSEFAGAAGAARVYLPLEICNEEVLGVLHGLKRTLFECRFSDP